MGVHIDTSHGRLQSIAALQVHCLALVVGAVGAAFGLRMAFIGRASSASGYGLFLHHEDALGVKVVGQVDEPAVVD